MNWECPYCRRAQIVTTANSAEVGGYLKTCSAVEKNQYAYVVQIRCLATECDRITMVLETYRAYDDSFGTVFKSGTIKNYSIEPQSSSKIFQADIHPAIIQDYEESCAIAELSPKASATLARRCLQGMIRDSCKIVKGSLADQITELRLQVEAGAPEVRHVDLESLDAIDGIRSIGNIGAHMEKNIDIIVDVEPEEARLLIGLIESLLESWYVERQRRAKRFAGVTALAAQKASERKPPPPGLPAALPSSKTTN